MFSSKAEKFALVEENIASSCLDSHLLILKRRTLSTNASLVAKLYYESRRGNAYVRKALAIPPDFNVFT